MNLRKNQILSGAFLGVFIYIACTYDDGDYQQNIIIVKTAYSDVYHYYDNQVDIRLIVLAYNRAVSLQKCLDSLQGVATDGLQISLEVWIDRDSSTGEVDLETLRVARDFRWTNGPINVWLHSRHVGLIGQWLYTWRPPMNDGVVSMDELALFIEDDIDTSPYALRWLHALHDHLRNRDDVACYALQDENVMRMIGPIKQEGREIPKPADTPAYLYRVPGSWGMAPQPQKWHQFQDWYEDVKADDRFHPYVKKAPLLTKWYKGLEKVQRQDTMWTMWFMYFMDKHDLFCAYSNLPSYTGRSDVSLSSNRREAGLHYSSKESQDNHPPKLLEKWDSSLIQFPDDLDMYEGSAKKINGYVMPRYVDTTTFTTMEDTY
jgi:hypothetical protein